VFQPWRNDAVFRRVTVDKFGAVWRPGRTRFGSRRHARRPGRSAALIPMGSVATAVRLRRACRPLYPTDRAPPYHRVQRTDREGCGGAENGRLASLPRSRRGALPSPCRARGADHSNLFSGASDGYSQEPAGASQFGVLRVPGRLSHSSFHHRSDARVAGAVFSWLEEDVPAIDSLVPGILFPSRADPQVAQAILTGIAASIMTVVSIVFAILLMTLTWRRRSFRHAF
jgi:hypothetical protein